MSRNPILKVLSTFRRCDVRALLMGGQACILYGAAEFSRDTDFALQPTEENLERVRNALRDLAAALLREQERDRELDLACGKPLRRELEAMRHRPKA